MSLLGNLFKGAVKFVGAGLKSVIGGSNASGQPSAIALQQQTPTKAVTFDIKWVFAGIGGVLLLVLLVFGLGGRRR